MTSYLSYLYLLAPLHTGGTTQEGNLLGIARESHTDLPYLPSSTIRGRFRATTPEENRKALWGNTIEDVKTGDENLTQGALWNGDGSILWFPVPSLSHGVVWISSPFLLRRWTRLTGKNLPIPPEGSFSGGNKKPLYLRDAVFKSSELSPWPKEQWQSFLPAGSDETKTINTLLVLSFPDCNALIQSSLWRQVRVKLDEKKNTDGGFRYEEAIPPETLMFFPWGSTASANGTGQTSCQKFTAMLESQTIWQIGGQESLGRGFVELWSQK
ncbi:MAG: type III-B CRISPR module RAMP protein Cmr4 [Kovacikia sp.]